MSRPLFCLSLGEADAVRLGANGPRRDVLELAAAVDARIVFRGSRRRASGIRTRLFGPHLAQALRAAREARDANVVFADGEHIGIPLAFAMAARGRKAKLVVLGHYLDRPWKRALLWAASRLKRGGTIAVHSVAQQRLARAAVHASWSVKLLPYQVDTDFWRAEVLPAADAPPLIVAVGAEHRDYETLLGAVDGLDVPVVIAAGSHWARRSSDVSAPPANVHFLSEPLPFADLRELYARASVVAVPLLPVTNQSGVTTILEAMSMGVPVVVSANPGQREVVRGPLMTADGEDPLTTADRGPAAFGLDADGVTGVYVPPADVPALRSAITSLLADHDRRASIGAAGRADAVAFFGVDAFVERFTAILGTPPVAAPEARPRAAAGLT